MNEILFQYVLWEKIKNAAWNEGIKLPNSKESKIFAKYNSRTDVVRCPNGRANIRKALNLYAKAAVNLYGVISKEEFVEIFNSLSGEQTTIDEIYILLGLDFHQIIQLFFVALFQNSQIRSDI